MMVADRTIRWSTASAVAGVAVVAAVASYERASALVRAHVCELLPAAVLEVRAPAVRAPASDLAGRRDPDAVNPSGAEELPISPALPHGRL